MASGLSFLFQAKTGTSKRIAEAFTTNPVGPSAPDILHYLWAVEVPGMDAPDGYANVLLTTVYDEQFEPYIEDLVKADPEPFNLAASQIFGAEGLIPVQDHLSEFVEFVRKHDLTQVHPAGPFKAFYPWTAALIHERLGPHETNMEDLEQSPESC